MHFLVNQDAKRLMLQLLVLIPLLMFSDHIRASQSTDRLLVLGDSLSAGYGMKQEQSWVSLLQNAWQDKGIIVINAAISGETTDGGLARLPRLLETHQPSHLLIELGGNDGLQGHNTQKIKENLAAMIALAQEQGVTVLLQQMQIPTNYGRRYNQMFTQLYEQLAEEYKVAMIPFFLQEIALEDELMQRDGIHPTAEAQPQIKDFMAEKLAPFFTDSLQSKTN